MNITVLGIDAGLRRTGWGVVLKSKTQLEYIAAGIINNLYTEVGLTKRLGAIFDQIRHVIQTYKPDHCSIENTYINSNYETSLKLAQARTAAMLACYAEGLVPVEYQASTIKKSITGSGKADKVQIAKMVSLFLNKSLAELSLLPQATVAQKKCQDAQIVRNPRTKTIVQSSNMVEFQKQPNGIQIHKLSDATDALATAICHSYHINYA
ncbi:Crossover junction endodeoxyribonuclease RuvC [Alphaproteobacteria bacterium]